MSNNEKPMNDQELEDYLAGNSDISALYAEQSKEQAPSDLDGFVVDAARKPAASKQKTKKAAAKPTRRPTRWMQPLAAVATLVLGLALTLDLLQDQAIVPASKLPTFADAPEAGPAEVSLSEKDSMEQARATDQARKKAQAQSKAKSEFSGGRSAPQPPSDIQKPEPIAPQAASDQVQSIAEEPVQAPRVSAAKPQEEKQRAAAPAPRSRELQQAPRDDEALGAQRSQPASPVNPQSEPRQQEFSPEPILESEAPQKPQYRENKQTWLRQIVFLADTRQMEKARSELQEFRKRFPDTALPPELEALRP